MKLSKYAKNLSGKRFNRLTVIEPIGKKGNNIVWKCLCDCGEYTNVPTNHLPNGHTKSCGCWIKEYCMSQRKDLKNQKFGKLIALKSIGVNKRYSVIWLCKCDCGNYKKTICHNLLKKDKPTKSCGCLQKEWTKKNIGSKHWKWNPNREEIKQKKIFRRFMHSTLRRQLINKTKHSFEYFNIPFQEFFEYFDQQLFKLKMIWKDIGKKLVFDHIIPLDLWFKCGFDERDIFIINDLLNLRLITKQENSYKHCRILPRLCLSIINELIKKYPHEYRLLTLKETLQTSIP